MSPLVQHRKQGWIRSISIRKNSLGRSWGKTHWLQRKVEWNTALFWSEVRDFQTTAYDEEHSAAT
jgi:iron complex outermembrane receptor protein